MRPGGPCAVSVNPHRPGRGSDVRGWCPVRTYGREAPACAGAGSAEPVHTASRLPIGRAAPSPVKTGIFDSLWAPRTFPQVSRWSDSSGWKYGLIGGAIGAVALWFISGFQDPGRSAWQALVTGFLVGGFFGVLWGWATDQTKGQ